MLHTMPIADILRHREVVLGTTLAGTERNIDSRIYHSNSGTVGLWDRLEIGWAHDYEKTTSFSVKALLFENERGAVSAGVMSWRGDAIDPYVAARLDRGWFRLHLGWIRQEGVSRGMIGFDADLGSGWTLMADHLSGPGSFTWVGFATELPGLAGGSITLGLGIPSRRPDGFQGSFNVSYGFRF